MLPWPVTKMIGIWQAGARELGLQVQTVCARKAHVEHEAARPPHGRVVEELLRGRERPDGVAHAAYETLSGVADGRVVVHDEHCRFAGASHDGRPGTAAVPQPMGSVGM